MQYNLLADMVVILHFSFVLFVIFGGVAALRWRCLKWLHIPAVLWGVFIEISGWICPLTYLENFLRKTGGESGYSVSFIEKYLEPLLYPLGLTYHVQIEFGLSVLLINLGIYAYILKQRGA